jgi:predicted enzyme related to lactoylglutathione lyase
VRGYAHRLVENILCVLDRLLSDQRYVPHHRVGSTTVQLVAMEVLFASLPVATFDAAIEWYERFFGRAADIIPNDDEAMWRVADNGWLYVINDPKRAGRTAVTISVGDLAEVIAALAHRGISAEPIEVVGDEGLKSNVQDPDGNVLSLIQVA